MSEPRRRVMRAMRAAMMMCLAAITPLAAQSQGQPAQPAAGKVLREHAPATLGVYQGAGCSGLKRLPQFSKWLGRKPELMLEFISWDVLAEGSSWAVKCWQRAGQKKVVYSLPMLPPDHSASLAQGAAGKYDELFRRYAAILVEHGFGDSIIRIGWEFNGHWYAWQSGKDPQSWIKYWRRIVDIMRATRGSNFKFDWNPAGGWTKHKAQDAYPGDDYVDIIGLDFYNSIRKPPNSPQEHWGVLKYGPQGLQWHRDFAQAHGKPMSYPEWGTGFRPDGSGGGDDPYFVEAMAKWIAANDVVYHNYWDYPDRSYDGRLSEGDRQPAAAAAFRRAFGQGER